MSESNRYELARRLADSLHGKYELLDARVWLRDGETEDYLPVISASVAQMDQYAEVTAGDLQARGALGLGADLKPQLGYVEIPGWRSMDTPRQEAITSRIEETAQAMAASAAISSATDESPRKIVIADENAALRRSVRAVLHFAGYEVVEATDGRMVIDRTRAELPDLVLMAWQLSVINGKEATAELKKDRTTQRIPIVMLTRRNAIEDKVEALDAGVQDFITKPFDFRELLARIDQQVRWRKLLEHGGKPAGRVGVAPTAPEESIGAELARLNALFESKDYGTVLKEAMAAAEFSEDRGEFEGAAQAYALAGQAAEVARRPDLANRLERLSGTMYLRLAENSKDTSKIEMGYTMSARMFLKAGNLALAEQAAKSGAPSAKA
jgi:DNA-binding response OmpR family regulator